MADNNLIGYLPKKTVIHQLSGFTKLLCFLMISVVGMISYDTRFLLVLALFLYYSFSNSKNYVS